MATEADLPNARPDHEHDTMRHRIERAMDSVYGLFQASFRPMPTQTGDGSYITHEKHKGLLSDLSKLDFRDMLAIADMIKHGVSHKPINDSDYLMERVIKDASQLDPTSKNGHALSCGFVDLLWNDLQHPPISYLGDDYLYRKADGSNNNIRWPRLGAAGTPYARTVSPKIPADFAMPDPSTLFDTLMVRKGDQPHPNRITSVLFYLATIIIHDCFKTDRKDSNITSTSSYLDLAPLYGSDQEQQDEVRTFKDGMLKPDCFSDKRVLGFPPGVGVLLVMFNRFHNYIAAGLAQINENDRFRKPRPGDEAGWKKYDNDLFQTSRLITCGLYVNIILKDYVRVILNLQTTESVWDLDPRTKQGNNFLVNAAQGTGNQVSAEFNLLYRWHSTVSARDAAWTEQRFREFFPDKDPLEVDWHELVVKLSQWENTLPADPQARCFSEIERDVDGKLNDDDLVDILQASIEDVAGAFGANRVPAIFRSVEILGIMQARRWNLATLNEFREFFNLKKHETFEQINSDPHVANQLRHLYCHPDKVELYPGIVVEEAKEPMLGSGLCPGFTISRAILSDAVSLVRGDRFYTVDYTPRNLTSWGFKEASYDNNFDQGHVFYKLILRSFPNHFRHNSVYAHFPMTEPLHMRTILRELHKESEYDYESPVYEPPPVFINTWAAGTKILNDKNTYGIMWGDAVTYLMHHDGKAYGTDFMLSGDGPDNFRSRQLMQCGIYRDGWETAVRSFYEKTTIDMIHTHAYRLGDEWEVDMVRDVGNTTHVHFAAEVFNLPLKTKKNKLNPFAEQELYGVMAMVFICIFFGNLDTAKEMQLRQFARTLTQELGEMVERRVQPLGSNGWHPLSDLKEQIRGFHKLNPLSAYGEHMIIQLLQAKPKLSVKDIVWSHLLGTAGGMVAIQVRIHHLFINSSLTRSGPTLRSSPRLLPPRGERAPLEDNPEPCQARESRERAAAADVHVGGGADPIVRGIATEGAERRDGARWRRDPLPQRRGRACRQPRRMLARPQEVRQP
jgi:linoleate 8R-lipoxygenase / 9,12-octadecadienoate 8-hydroperoxide 8R-isomerase